LNSVHAPKYIRKIKGFYILWFDYSNKYIVVNKDVMSLLNMYLESSNESDFLKRTNKQAQYSQLKSKEYYIELSELLQECSITTEKKPKTCLEFIPLQKKITVYYKINDFVIQINYSSENVKALIHPQFAHFQNEEKSEITIEFDVYLKNNELILYKQNTFCSSFPKENYHLLQGKFAIEILCLLTNKHENDWLGTFHASTIGNTKESIMLIGESGKGKSTLSAILMANGFDLIADDFTPVLAESQNVYRYPSAISIKQGSYNVLKTIIPEIKDLPINNSNGIKGNIRYIPSTIKFNPHKEYPCHKIICVNYQENSQTELTEISIDNVLNILIPDSWISPEPKNVECFLTWLETCTFHKLTYSDADEVVQKFKTIFNEQNID